MNFSSALNIVLGCLAALSFALTFWRWAASRRFPLHQRIEHPPKTHPSITILKPLKGADPFTRQCLESWFTQNYPAPVQLLFGVASANDPVCKVVQDLICSYPKTDARLIICDKALAPNAKVSTLIQLQQHIRHELVVISDADVHVPADMLSNLVAKFESNDVGLVNCFYRLSNPSTLAMRWEAIGVNSDFWSQVLQAQTLKPIDFALGAVMALPRKRLEAIGGFVSLGEFLADDYQLGQKVVRTGAKIAFCPVVASCYESSSTWKQVWTHQLRWSRTIRICQPVPFFFSILNNATIWPLLWLAYSAAIGFSSSGLELWFIGFCIFFRIERSLQMQRRLVESTDHIRYWWLIPVNDLLAVVTWAMAFWGDEIIWRGDRFRVLPGGKLLKLQR